MNPIGQQPLLADTLGVILPDREETLILRACLSDRMQAAASWQSWIGSRLDLKGTLAEGWPSLKRLLPLLKFALTENNIAVNEPTLAVLRAATLWEERRARRVSEILGEALGALDAASVTPILLKGVALAETAYPVSSLRHCHDIDLLVSPADLEQAKDALAKCGFNIIAARGGRHAALSLAHADGLPISLHHRLLLAPLFSLPESEMRERTIAVTIACGPVRMLCPMDMLLHLCGQLAGGTMRDSTSWVADAVFLLRRFPPTAPDWTLVARVAEKAGLALPLFVMLSYLRTEIGFAIPDHVLTSVGERARRTSMAHRDAALANARKGPHGRLGAMIRRSNWRSRVEIARWLVAPSRPFLETWCGERGLRASPIWYVARPLRRLAIRAGVVGRVPR